MKNKPLKEIASVWGLASRKKVPVTHFAIDSREVKKGGVFFALAGAKTDGHQFLEEAAKKGALGAVVSNEYTGADFGLELLRVKDVVGALQNLAKAAMANRKEKIIGVTGSIGKTTVKEFLATLLESKLRVSKSFGNCNSQRTFPLNLLNLEGEYDVLVLEMAMTQRGQIKRLAQIAPPEIAILTRIAPTEIKEGLGAIAAAKAEIFSQAETTLGIISCQAAQFKEVLYAGGVKKWIYGWKEDFEDHREGDFVMEAVSGGVIIEDSPVLSLSFEAKHLAEDFLAAAAASRALGLSWDAIRDKAKELKPFERRFEKIERDGMTFIQDCYNASPESVLAALKNLPKGKGKRVGVLGTMPNLGKHSPHFHKQIGLEAKNHLDHVLCIGEETKNTVRAFSNGAEHFGALAEVKKALFSLIEPGDVVLIKGGNYLKLWELLED